MSDLQFKVSAEQGGERLDRLVAQVAGVSRRIARLWISKGLVRVGGRPLRILTRPLRAGAEVVITPDPDADPVPERETSGRRHAAPRILLLDRYLLVLDKPAGLLSERDRFGSPSLEDIAPALLRAQGERDELWLVHRLDAGTSGVIVMARTKLAVQVLSEAFRKGEVHKTYVAVVKGALREPCTVDAPIARAERTRHHVAPGGKPALTEVAPLSTGRDATLVQAEPRTGRTHQIRVHLAHLGHPLYGDRLYGGPMYTGDAPPRAVGRPMLHARDLALSHPKTGAPLRLTAPPPRDFVDLVHGLGLAAEESSWEEH